MYQEDLVNGIGRSEQVYVLERFLQQTEVLVSEIKNIAADIHAIKVYVLSGVKLEEQ